MKVVEGAAPRAHWSRAPDSQGGGPVRPRAHRAQVERRDHHRAVQRARGHRRRERVRGEPRRAWRGGEKRKREKREDPAWLQGNTRVRIVSKSFEGGRLYLKKGVVVDVLTPRECVVEINDSGEVLSGVPQRVLETALPKRARGRGAGSP